jgi:proteasome lid subunit RPN8/RPN11
MHQSQIANRKSKIRERVVTLQRAQVEAMFEHARTCLPAECCGLVGGHNQEAKSIYPIRNVAASALTEYEAAPEELFKAQRAMRERREELIGIYHSHPASDDPTPSSTDVRLAFYPSAVYFIIGFTQHDQPILTAFRIAESEGTWARVDVEIIGR